MFLKPNLQKILFLRLPVLIICMNLTDVVSRIMLSNAKIENENWTNLRAKRYFDFFCFYLWSERGFSNFKLRLLFVHGWKWTILLRFTNFCVFFLAYILWGKEVKKPFLPNAFLLFPGIFPLILLKWFFQKIRKLKFFSPPSHSLVN